MTTPTSSVSGLDHVPGTFRTLWQALDYAAQGQTGVNFYNSETAVYASLTYTELRDRARALAGKLAARFQRGAHIGLIAETSPDFVVSFMACQYAGMIAAPMSLPAAFGRRETYKWQIAKITETAALATVMTSADYRALIEDIVAEQSIPVFDLSGDDLGEATAEPIAFEADEPSYLQFSSGSTSEPKGIFATQQSVMANVHAISDEGLKITGKDRMASWLPFYHDMGLVGFFLVPMCNQCSLDCMSPSTFARRPGLWLRVISENRGTITYSPSFGYGLSARRYRGEELDLSCLRVAGIGGDMIEHDVLARFADVFGPLGFTHNAFVASYGMAEATLAISFVPLNRGPYYDTVGLQDLQTKSRAEAPSDGAQKQRIFTACGVPLSSFDMAIRNADGDAVASREIGEVMLKGPCLAQGYFRAGKGVEPLCDADGWFATGDLGYWLNDEIVITGRSKDLMLWNGKNIWPQDLEWVAQKAAGTQISRAAAFDFRKEDGTSQVMLLAECRVKDNEVREKIKRDIVSAVRDVVGVPFKFVFVMMHSLPVTSSGKLSRSAAKVRYLEGELTDPYADNEDADLPSPKHVSASAV